MILGNGTSTALSGGADVIIFLMTEQIIYCELYVADVTFETF